jgi:hypothetical protein
VVTTVGEEWADNMEDDERMELAEIQRQERAEIELAKEEDGWKAVLHYEVTSKMVRMDYTREDMRGVHFYTATAKYLFENPKMAGWDKTGYGEAPSVIGNHEVAEEWLGEMYLAGVRRLGGGGTFEQLRFSRVARKGLLGGGVQPPEPLHLAMFFTQLFNAGEKGGRARQTNEAATGADGKGQRRLHFPVPEIH